MRLDSLPRGFTDDGRRLRRSPQTVTKRIDEDASRGSAGAERQRFEEAEGGVGETAVGLEELVSLGALSIEQVEPVHVTWERTRAARIGLDRTLP